jgi:hypothetical protein
MSASEEKDVTWLYHWAQRWHINHPENQIPLDLWESKCRKAGDLENEGWKIYFSEYESFVMSCEMIPVLAAIGIGKTGSDLLNVILHHQPETSHFAETDFTVLESADDYSRVPDDILEFQAEMSPWHIVNEVVQAISLGDELARSFHEELYCDSERHEFSVALALSDNPLFWPSTVIQEDRYRVVEDCVTNKPTPEISLNNSGADLSGMSNIKILEFLKNSGNMLPKVCAENGFTVNFARDVFVSMDRGDCANTTRVVEAINSIEDLDQLRSTEEILLQKLLNCTYYPPSNDGMFTLRGIEKTLNHEKYPRLLDSVLLRLNLVTATGIRALELNEPEIAESQVLRAIIENQDSVFDQLCRELLDTTVEDFRKGHFGAIEAFAEHWEKPASLGGVDLPSVIEHLSNALHAYKSTPHVNFIKEPSSVLHDAAEKGVKAFFSWLVPTLDLRDKGIQKLPSSAKMHLAQAGGNIKLLPGMTTKDKGRLISDALGL